MVVEIFYWAKKAMAEIDSENILPQQRSSVAFELPHKDHLPILEKHTSDIWTIPNIHKTKDM